jgi:hypothetical protein
LENGERSGEKSKKGNDSRKPFLHDQQTNSILIRKSDMVKDRF